MYEEFEKELEVPLRLKIRFSATKAEPRSWDSPGCPASIDDIEFKIVTDEVVTPLVLKLKGTGYVTKEVEHPVSDGLHDVILSVLDWNEWQELCFEYLRENNDT